MAKDIFHQQVKAAPIESGWTITHDPYLVKITDVITHIPHFGKVASKKPDFTLPQF
jgi:hypothetical protein